MCAPETVTTSESLRSPESFRSLGSLRSPESREAPGSSPSDQATPRRSGETEPGEKFEKGSRIAGRIGQALSKIPTVITFVPRFLYFTVLDAALPLAGVAATLGGFGAVVGLGVAGAIEALQGVRHRDAAQVLTGTTDAARGIWVGAATAQRTLGMGAPAAAALAIGGAVHGAASIACGIVKMKRDRPDLGHSERIEGALLIGTGVASLAAATGALLGPAVLGPAVVAQTMLATARVCYVNHEKIGDWMKKAGHRAHETWDHFKDLFRPEPGSSANPAEAGPAPVSQPASPP